MFNALNRFISRLDGDEAQGRSQQPGGFGFQILRNTNPEVAIDPWFDYIVGINGRAIDNPSSALFAQEVRNCAGSTVTLGLWNAKGQRTRTLYLPVPQAGQPLGLSLQWTPLALASNIWHILDIPANSPADLAGLLPYSDYILGSPEAPLYGESALSEIVEDYIGRPLRLWVYNNEYDVTREVTVTPSRTWGGEGALGCVLGFGALHRLPAPLSEPVDAPGATMFDGEVEKTPVVGYGGGGQNAGGMGTPVFSSNSEQIPLVPQADLLVPADLAASGPPPSSASQSPGLSRQTKKREGRAHHAPKAAMDDYFDEQEKKSKEMEGPAASRTGTPIAPPPKAGGPPRGGPPRSETPKAEDAAEE